MICPDLWNLGNLAFYGGQPMCDTGCPPGDGLRTESRFDRPTRHGVTVAAHLEVSGRAPHYAASLEGQIGRTLNRIFDS